MKEQKQAVESMQLKQVSIVVPVYNMEKYLDRCIMSIVNQTYRNLEIILVDDGSTDRSSQMCEEWARKDNRIQVIHQENAGQGLARNTGMEYVTGSCVFFMDSDDDIERNTIELAYGLMKKEAVEVVKFGLSIMSAEGKILGRGIPAPSQWIYRGAEVHEKFVKELVGPDPKTGKSAGLANAAWSCLISMDLIRRANWKFVSEREIISEDLYSMLALFAHVQSVAILPKALYRYHENEESFSHSYRPDRFEKIKHFYREYIGLCRRCGYSAEVERRCSSPFISFTIAAMKQEAAYHRNILTAIKRVREIVYDPLLQQVLWEIRKDKTNRKKQILFFTMRHKCYILCYLLLLAQNISKSKK